jgi:hypothetical protein
MRQKALITAKIVLTISLIPLFSANQDCNVPEIEEMLCQAFGTCQGGGGTAIGEEAYISHLTFMDAQTKTMLVQTEYAELLNKALVDGMNKASMSNSNIKVNQPGHTLPNTDASVNTLVNITFDPNLDKAQKIGEIVTALMDPHDVDVIVTGMYVDNAGSKLIEIRPLIIVKKDQKIVSKNLQFEKAKLFCADPADENVTALCTSAHDDIKEAVAELLENV